MKHFFNSALQKPFAAGISSALLSCTGGAILIVQTALQFHLTNFQLVSWLFMCYTIAGIFNIVLTLKYKIPIAGAHSITAIAFLSTSTIAFSYHELIGTYFVAGLLILLLGMSRLFGRLFDYIPRPVIEAMLAGILLQFILKIVPIYTEHTLVAALALIGFLLAILKFKKIPPMILVLLLSCIGLLFTYSFTKATLLPFSLPQFATPEFSWFGFISIALPLAILVLSNDLAVAVASLKNNEYQVKINHLVTLTGIATMLGSFFGAHSINPGGMMTTLCNSDEAGEKQKRYIAGIISSIGCILFGLFAWFIVPYMLLLPPYFITLIVGFSLLGLCINSLKQAFSHEQYRYSVVFAFIISTANVSFFGVSSALWSLIIGSLVAFVFKEGIYEKRERKHDEQ